MTGFELKMWRKGLKWTQAQAADEFGISLRSYVRYENTAPPRVVQLAITALSLKFMMNDINCLDADLLRTRLRILASSIH
ncbi:helix-turn-helix domain-containing protein [Serratia sp. JSRIV001]|uniref:helix-turn-helix domain-containing protein n=1 Tax=unclassified Serratia (in: enterobacteria) TaxID=2647522 RepID=UPI001CBB82C3|nr:MULTISPECIES: helix-turn-helix domain-containing protein [unclassified Serratia (in: enterobacteria)]UAN45191.1 helix-turn-helix domain-containing protein [Serratia sp. JSRIV001]UAN54536.1 helix-turn-helix domain-containing protein [Serratia sp. JSRIV002]UAN60547.1 helix-turn-helix domain-containing protein [Serratia sp. JSRIV004]